MLDFNYEENFKKMEHELIVFCELKEAGYVLNEAGVWCLPKDEGNYVY